MRPEHVQATPEEWIVTTRANAQLQLELLEARAQIDDLRSRVTDLEQALLAAEVEAAISGDVPADGTDAARI